MEGQNVALTNDQQQALEAIAEWWNGGAEKGEKHFILSGEPGSGKTFLAKQAVKQLKTAVPLFTAPTNEAVYQLQQALGDYSGEVVTTARALGLAMRAREEKQVLAPTKEPMLEDYNLLVVDEASMVGGLRDDAEHEELLDYILASGISVLWLGDPQQLPPIYSDRKIDRGESPVFDESFVKLTGASRAHLSEIVRHSGDLLQFVRSIRSEKKQQAFPEYSASVKRIPPRSLEKTLFETQYFEAFLAGEARYIAWTNKRVDEINAKIRAHRFGEAIARTHPFCAGDQILFAAPVMLDRDAPLFAQDFATFHKSKQYGTLVTTNAKGEVTSVEDGELWGIKCYSLYVKLESGQEPRILVPTAQGAKRLAAIKSRLAKEAKEAKAARNWKLSHELWKHFHAVTALFGQLKHSYAMTGHRSQGSTIPIVFADADNLLGNFNTKIGQKNFYVAVSRAQKELLIVIRRVR